MKQFFFTLLLFTTGCSGSLDILSLTTTDALNSRGQSIEQVAQNKTNQLATRLNLNKEQKDRVYKLCLESLQKRMDIIPLKKTNKDEYASKMKKLVDDTYSQITALLTPEQKKKMEKLKAEADAVKGEY